MNAYDQDVLWIVIVGFLIAFVLAFGIGANDVANSFGTSVGSKVLTLKKACIIASIFEISGSVLIGARVSDTVRKGIIDINSFKGDEKLAMIGSFSALGGTSIWLLVASFLRLPVSGTHSVVGSTIGYALVEHGYKGVQWKKFGLIAASWVTSPLASGIISCLIFLAIRIFILKKNDSFEVGLKLLPFIYAITIAINLFSVFYKGSHLLRFNRIPLYGVFILTFGGALIFAILVRFLFVPWLRKRINEEVSQAEEPIVQYTPTSDVEKKVTDTKTGATVEDESETVIDFHDDSGEISLMSSKNDGVTVDLSGDQKPSWKNQIEKYITGDKQEQKISKKNAMNIAREMVVDEPKTSKLFSFLQVLTASFGAFAHGGNDVSNAIGPLVSVWIIYQTGELASKVQTPVWILFYGGVGIVVGLWIWGRRVIKTMGEDLTPITPSSGFTIEIGSALTVLVASNLGIPISTTHCKVGSVVMVGRLRSREVVDWRLFRNIILSWIVTIPVAGGLSAAIYAGLRECV